MPMLGNEYGGPCSRVTIWSESGEGVTVAGTSPNPRLRRRLARAKVFLADVRSDRRMRRSAQV